MPLFSNIQWDKLIQDFAQPLTMPLLRFLWGWMKRMVPLFIILLVILSLTMSAFDYFRRWRDRPIKFLVGPAGATGAEQADAVEQELRESWSFWRPNYSVARSYTAGFPYNQRIINADLEGSVIGFAMEGLQNDETRNLRTLLPLEWCFLHFLYRVDSLPKIGLKLSEEKQDGTLPAITFGEWADAVRMKTENKPKIYLGPRSGGTRQVAEVALEYGNIDPEEIDVTGISDFDEMVLALKRGTIDGAFFLAPRGSDQVVKVARIQDHPCTLISIDKASDLAKVHAYLEHGSIHPFEYPFEYKDAYLGAVQTLAVRRVLVASSQMSASDAYHLSQHAQRSLRDRLAERGTDGRWPGPDGEPVDRKLAYELHPGATSDTGAEPSFTWLSRNSTWLAPLLLAMIVSLATEVRAGIVQRLDGHVPPTPLEPPAVAATGNAPPDQGGGAAKPQVQTPDEAPAPDSREVFDDVQDRIELLAGDLSEAGNELIRTGIPVEKEALGSWTWQVESLYRRIARDSRADRLSSRHVTILREAMSKLRENLAFLQQPPVDFSNISANPDASSGRASDGESGPSV